MKTTQHRTRQITGNVTVCVGDEQQLMIICVFVRREKQILMLRELQTCALVGWHIEPLRLAMLEVFRLQVHFSQQPTGYNLACCGLDLRTIQACYRHRITSPNSAGRWHTQNEEICTSLFP